MTPQNPPGEWPVIVIGGASYPLDWNYRVTYRASKQGLDFRKLGTPVDTFAAHMDLLAIVLQPIFEKKGERVPSGEEWAGKIDSMDHFKQIVKALNQAYEMSLKLQPAATPPVPQETATGILPN